MTVTSRAEGQAMAEPQEGAPHRVEIRGLSKSFRRRSGAGTIKPIDDITLSIQDGEFLVLLGPSGCGKTTLLRSIAGLERPDEGSISIDGTTVYDSGRGIFLPPNRRPISMIFQSYALWPHMTIFKNVAYPLRSRKSTRRLGHAEIAARVEQALAKVGLVGLGDQYPGQLSGGQQQRVALARALVSEAQVLLFDEPLSNVDAKVREELRAQLVEMQRELGFTAIYVTHDQAEAMELADRIAVLNSGRIEQLDPPRRVYQRPQSRYVAEFIGSANLVAGVVRSLDERAVVDTALGSFVIEDYTEHWTGDTPLGTGDSVTLMFRPEDCLVDPGPDSRSNMWDVELVRTSFTGVQQHLLVHSGDERLIVLTTNDAQYPEGAKLRLGVERHKLHLLPPVPAESGAA
ncbi:ABC transporter ATP-binding protein [Sediminivirga luteola]|nr:ABC transporter ATP-binding protein [Sediminivirga luteola]MCI2266476.1 ABC transporter ATP-binding protein [Sediminivirga luteola]